MDINKNCSIVNNSGKNVVVLNAVNSSTNVAQNSPQQGYLQDLTLLPVASGAKVLTNGATDSVTLDGTYVDSTGQTQSCYIYQLLVSQPNSLFPVMAVGEMLDFTSMSYPPITVTAAAAANMSKALSFCQNIMTSPSSKMAVAFQSVLDSAFNQQTITAGEQAIAAFFNQYPLFAGLDFPSYVAVSTWLRAYAYLWGMGNNDELGCTYYVYSGSATGTTAVKAAGTIVFQQKAGAPSPADPSDRQSGMTITLNSPTGGTTDLQFDEGQIVDAAGAVVLNATFGFKGTFTAIETDTTVWPILCGTMLNQQVIAIPLAPTPQSTGSNFWSLATFDDVLMYFFKAVGLWMAIDFVAHKLSGKNNKARDDQANENNGDQPSQQQLSDAESSGEAIGEESLQNNQQKLQESGGSVEDVPSDNASFASSVEGLRTQSANVYNAVAGDSIKGGLDSAEAAIGELSKIEMTQSIEDAYSNVIAALQSLNDGDFVVANQNLIKVTKSLPEIVEAMGAQVSQSTAQQIKEAVAVQTEASNIADESIDHANEAASGDEDSFESGLDIND
ncbi:hypothetical protein [Burkholderia sp. BDU5]|uniref:hypothetical protein n=1 Tax=Burkholderia sp. BDU5 TaxID=1385590 RepID=UPI00075C6084|nr:hypothetical protein [Burkholderia sp. BDU5]KVE38574.1 hypothetical protein WS69_08390 [Burkholderia sp. BDU5]